VFCIKDAQLLGTTVQNFVVRAGARHLSIAELKYFEKGSFVWT